MKRIIEPFPILWTVTQLDKPTGKPIGSEIPARVPGDVFSDLFRAGKIPDPYLGLNSRQVQWVNNFDWLYQGRVKLPAGTPSRVWLEFMGLDYRYTISWNSRTLAQGEGMFSRNLFEVGPGVRDSNLIEVRFSGLPDHWTESRFPPSIVNTEGVRRHFLKTQMSFGWDFAPRLKGCGIWDRVSLFATGPVLIQDLWVRARNNGDLDLEFTLQSSSPAAATLKLSIFGETFAGFGYEESVPLELTTGVQRCRHRLSIPEPRQWWPWDLGRPELYRLSAAVQVEGKPSDAVEEVFGFREIGFSRNPNSPAQALDWTLQVNGLREFMRGANWVPAEAMLGRLSDDRYEKLLQLAREANLNTLRVWGGGIRERPAFYSICDRLGILVWQEFPLACVNFRYPRSARFQSLLRQEAGEIVRQLRNHPSLFLWCGGNEFNARLNRPAIRVMEQVCSSLDPTRRFLPASPYRGDAHNYLVWHLKGNLSDYFADQAQVVSEFGLQAAPVVESLKEFLTGDLLWPAGRGWAHHSWGRGKMDKYVKHFGGPGSSLEDYVQAGQEAQAHYLHRAIEHWRRQKYRKSGALFWQWNEPWPCICWSVVDYYLRPKPAYEAVKIACQPLLVSAEFEQKSYRPGDRFTGSLVLVNDFPRAFPDLKIEVKAAGQLMQSLAGNIGPDQVATLAGLDFTLPPDQPPVLELRALKAGQEVSRNCYRLAFHDPEPARLLLRRLFRRYWQFLSE